MVDIDELHRYTRDMRILYVEDNNDERDITVALLKKFFTSVDTASDGEEGLRLYRNSQYDLVISDVEMPKLSGIKMSKIILDENPNQSIIINSAHSSAEYLLELINTGITYYLLKPVGLEHFVRVIYKVAKSQYDAKMLKQQHELMKQKNLELEQLLSEKNEIINGHYYKNSLTGIHNLFAFMKDTKEFGGKHAEFTVLILVDIDNLQSINDLYNRDVGNRVIVDFASLLQEFTKNYSYNLYHTSGDQFVLLDRVPYIDTERYEEELETLLQEIHNFSTYIDSIDKTLKITTTIGMSLGPENSLEHADMALKNAKEKKQAFAVYNTLIDSTAEMKEKMEWTQKIRDAIENESIVPVFHPIVDMNGKVVKYESLMRMKEVVNGEERLISPGYFLDVAFATKQYNALSNIMINKVLDALKWSDATVSINLSFSDIQDKVFMQALYSRIEKENLGSRLIVEITENENMQDYVLLKQSAEKLRHLGVKIAIDDFGSGYSNFGQILQIHPEYIKIDGTLIEKIDIDTHAYLLTKAISSFFNELGCRVIAEFVHSKDIYDILKNFKVDELQGYYFSEPILSLP